MTEYYYVQDARGYIGNSMVFWAQDSAGYTPDLKRAHKFTKQEVDAHSWRDTDIAWPADFIESRIQHHVDMQQCRKDDLAQWMQSQKLGVWGGCFEEGSFPIFVAAKNKTTAARLLGVTQYKFNLLAHETTGEEAVKIARENPGQVFRVTDAFQPSFEPVEQ